MGWQVHQRDHMQIICTLFQRNNQTNILSLNFFTSRMLILTPNQQCQSIEGKAEQTRIWSNAQYDGLPAEHRWRSLFSAAKYGSRPLLDAVQ